MIKAVIFDMDGVVIDSEPLYREAQEQLFREYGVTIPPEDWAAIRGVTEDRFYQLAQERYNIAEPLDTLQAKGRQYVVAAFAAGLDYYDGFQAAIGPLAKRYQLGLVTSTAQDLFRWIDDKLDLRQYFPEVVTADDTTHHKPHQEPYEEMMHRLKVTPQETAVVEDSIAGIQSALAAGVWTIALAGSPTGDRLPPSHRVIRTLGELTPTFIDNLVAA